MVFNATFNNISVISCWSVLLVEETGVRLLASNITLILHIHSPIFSGGRFDRMVVGFMTTYAISAYHH
jgi:hypothetical protein